MDNPGSFMSPAGGGGSALKEAMARRGMAGAALNQNTTSPNAVLPGTPPQGGGMPPAPMGGSMPAPALAAPKPPMPAPMPPGMGAVGMPPGGTDMEKQIILKSMDARMKAISNIEKLQLEMGGMGGV